MNTEQLLEALTVTEDTRECVRILGDANRTYTLTADEEEVWGCDPDGHPLAMSRSEFLRDWADGEWRMAS
jgi:hypothetical protein